MGPISIRTQPNYDKGLGSGQEESRRRRSSLSRIDSPSPSQSVSAIYASIGHSSGKNYGSKVVGKPPSKTTTHPPPPVTLRGGRHPPPWRPRSAYELLAYQNLQKERNQKINPNPSVFMSSKTLQLKPQSQQTLNSNESMSSSINANNSSSTLTSTEFQVQIPIGQIMNAAANSVAAKRALQRGANNVAPSSKINDGNLIRENVGDKMVVGVPEGCTSCPCANPV